MQWKRLFVWIFSCWSLFAQGQLTNGQLLHYPLNGNAIDISGNGLNGTLMGGPGFGTGHDGAPSGAVVLNGFSQYVAMPNSVLLRPPLPISFSIWINPSILPATDTYLFTMDESLGLAAGLFCTISNTQLGVFYGDGGPATLNNIRGALVVPFFIPLGVWTHISGIVRGPNNIEIFVDCVPQSVVYAGNGGGIQFLGGNGSIGRGTSPTGPGGFDYFNGLVDEFRLWNRALTNSEIQQLCQINCVNDTARIDTVLCNNDSIFFNNRWRRVAGFYQSITPLPNGCDSIAQLNLGFGNGFNELIFDTICQGQVYDYNGSALNAGGVYGYQAVDVNGCDSVSTLNLTLLPTSDSLWVEIDGNACRDGYLRLQTRGPYNGAIWNAQDTGTSLLVYANGVYNVVAFGPCGFGTASVLVNDECLPTLGEAPSRMFVPNAFSPNGDGLNDIFLPKGNGVIWYSFRVYNRWGAMVFESNDLQLGWNGQFEGEDQMPGAYLYMIDYKIEGDFYRRESGFVQLVR